MRASHVKHEKDEVVGNMMMKKKVNNMKKKKMILIRSLGKEVYLCLCGTKYSSMKCAIIIALHMRNASRIHLMNSLQGCIW